MHAATARACALASRHTHVVDEDSLPTIYLILQLSNSGRAQCSLCHAYFVPTPVGARDDSNRITEPIRSWRASKCIGVSPDLQVAPRVISTTQQHQQLRPAGEGEKDN